MDVTNKLMSTKLSVNAPKYVREIEVEVANRLKLIHNSCSELTEAQQQYFDDVLQVYREAFVKLMSKTVTYNNLLSSIRNSYENSIKVRDERIKEFKILDKAFGNKEQTKYKEILNENDHLREQNLKLLFEITKMKQELGKLHGETFSEHLTLMKERDVRYSLYFENVDLHLKLQQTNVQPSSGSREDPVMLRIALDRCRELLSTTQKELKKVKEEYEETVPRRTFDVLQGRHYDATDSLDRLAGEHRELLDKYNNLKEKKKEVDEELSEIRERCSELERAGTPRPAWEVCGDSVSGGRERWRQLRRGLGSRDTLRVLLAELGPAAAARTDLLDQFDGFGGDPSVPPYLRYEGKVRNLRLSRREVSVLITDIWAGKMSAGRGMSMQEYVTHYFRERYLQPSIRAEWAYNLCSGAEQMLDDCQVKLFWGVLHGHLSEDIYISHRKQWDTFKENLYSKGAENITVEELERVARSTFPLKSDVEIKNISDVVRKQLKLKLQQHDINLDKLFQENEEGFDRIELARELYRQRQLAQDRYLREVVAALGPARRGTRPALLTPDQLRRAFVIVDPAIDHVTLQKHVRWVFGESPSVPLRTACARLAAADVARVGPRRHHRPRRTTPATRPHNTHT